MILPSNDSLQLDHTLGNTNRPTQHNRRSISTRTLAVRNAVQADALFTVLNDQFSYTPSTDTTNINQDITTFDITMCYIMCV